MANDSSPVWVDTHCHLDAPEFDADRGQVIRHARAVGVSPLLIPAVSPDNLASVQKLAQQTGDGYCLGFHPLYLHHLGADDVAALAQQAQAALSDPCFVGIGEIGLDFFDPSAPKPDHQEALLCLQLQIARTLDLPVVMHVRRSADRLLACLRKVPVQGGIVHAFNGSLQQAMHFIERGFCLGFGGAATYTGSRQIRRLLTQLPETALVVETDAPDIPPSWLRLEGKALRNEPAQLARIGAELAAVRGMTPADFADLTRANAYRVLPRFRNLAGCKPA